MCLTPTLALSPTDNFTAMTTTLERSVSRTPSISMSMSSPRLSVRREPTPPLMSDTSLMHIHDHLAALDSRILELRSSVLTKDGYIDRRNREDEHIRREFDSHRTVFNRVDLNVAALRTDVDQLKSGVFQLQSTIGQSGTDSVFLRSDVDRLQKNLDQALTDLEQLQTDVCTTRVEISKIQTAFSQLRTDLITLQHETSRHLNLVSSRFSLMEARMKHSERVRFNSLAHTVHAPITSVPIIEDDGCLIYPDYFPRTVWRFWCLKKRSRIHRLIQLAEFYRLEGYHCWYRMYQSEPLFCNDSDSSDSSECANNMTRAEAVRQYPEAAHQALAATLGLVYYKIRNEVGEGPTSHLPARPPKRQQEEVASSSSKEKPVKIPRRPNQISPATLQKLTTGPSIESKSMVSEESDKLGWNAHSEVSDEAMHKIKGIVSDELGSLLRALERGHLKLKPSRSERQNMSPTESKSSFRNGRIWTDGAQEEEVPTIPNTVPTERLSPSSDRTENHSHGLPDTASAANSPLR